MIFSEWDEAVAYQDPQKEKKESYQQLTDDDVLLLLDAIKQLEECITDVQKEYGTRAIERSEIPLKRIIHHILDVCEVTNLIKANNIRFSK